jgi:autoinducer 2-degrading protein
MTVKAGRERDFERVCRELTEAVREREPAAIYFEFFRLREPRRYAVLESFTDEAAEQAHMATPWLAKVLPTIVECVDGSWEREYMDALDG